MWFCELYTLNQYQSKFIRLSDEQQWLFEAAEVHRATSESQSPKTQTGSLIPGVPQKETCSLLQWDQNPRQINLFFGLAPMGSLQPHWHRQWAKCLSQQSKSGNKHMPTAAAGQWRPPVSVCASGAGCKTFLEQDRRISRSVSILKNLIWGLSRLTFT